MTSPLQLAAESMLQAAMLNDSAAFDEAAHAVINGIKGKQKRPAMRGWMLGRQPNRDGVLSYRTNRFGLQCVDICAKTWAVVDYRDGKPKFWTLAGH